MRTANVALEPPKERRERRPRGTGHALLRKRKRHPMRIRALKPGSFLNEQLCSLSSFHRLLYAGLWLCADRQGRLQDRPKRLKAEIFPYDDADVDELLWDLNHAGFVRRYE